MDATSDINKPPKITDNTVIDTTPTVIDSVRVSITEVFLRTDADKVALLIFRRFCSFSTFSSDVSKANSISIELALYKLFMSVSKHVQIVSLIDTDPLPGTDVECCTTLLTVDGLDEEVIEEVVLPSVSCVCIEVVALNV